MKQRNNTEFDVVIVGGGLVGASLAIALAKAPLRIALIETKLPDIQIRSDYDARSVALSYSSQQILQHLNLWPLLQPHSSPITQVHVSDQRNYGATRITAEQQSVKALGYVIEIQYLQAVLNQVMTENQNITRFCPAKLVTLETGDAQSSLTISREDQTELKLQCDLVVAADGGQSFIRRLLKIKTKTKHYQQSAIISNISLKRDHQHIAYERFTPFGPLALLPLSDKRCSLVWSMQPHKVEKYLQLEQPDFLQALQKAFGYRLGRFVKVGERQVFPLTLTYAAEQVRQGVVLLGNAAHTLHPIAGQGFNLGLRDVAVLVDELLKAYRHKQRLGSLTLLLNYQKLRRNDQRNTIGLTDNLANLFSQDNLPNLLGRSLSMQLFEMIPHCKNLLARQTMGLIDKKLSKLICGIPLAIEEQ